MTELGAYPHHAVDAFQMSIGNMRVTPILDSYMPTPDGLLTRSFNESSDGDRRTVLTVPPSFITIFCFLIETGDRAMLVDSGLGGQETERSGRLISTLDQLGYRPDDISHVLFTHLHADHFGGVVTEDGEAVFRSARLWAHVDERDFTFANAPTDGEPGVMEQLQAAQKLRPILDRFEWVEEGEILPGVELIHLPGHTPGHAGIRIRSKGRSMLLWGDVVHQPGYQFSDPLVGVNFDADPERAVQTRISIMHELSSSGELVGGTHNDFPGVGHVRKTGAGFSFDALSWTAIDRHGQNCV